MLYESRARLFLIKKTSTSMNTLTMTDVSIERNWEENSRLKEFILQESDNGTLFHRPLFLQYHADGKFADVEPVVLSFHRKGRIAASITGAIVYDNGDRKFVSPFASSYGGLVLHRQLTFKEIEEIYLELFEILHKRFSTVRLSSSPSFHSQTGKSNYVEHILLNNGYQIVNSDIILVHELGPEQDLMNRIHKKTVTELKQPLFKNPLRLEIIDGTDHESYDLLMQSQERLQSLPTHSYEDLRNIERLIPGTVKTYKAFYGENLVAGIIVFKVTDTILNTFYVFDSMDGRALKANHFCYYSVLKHASEQNFNYVDFGPSSFGWRPNYPLISFKEKFDGQPFLRNTFEKNI